MKSTPKYILSLLTRSFDYQYSILATIASSRLLHIWSGDLFDVLNMFYIKEHAYFFKTLEEYTKESFLHPLKKVVTSSKYKQLDTLDKYSDAQELSMMGEVMDEYIKPIKTEIFRLSVIYDIWLQTYFGMDFPSYLLFYLDDVNIEDHLNTIQSKGVSKEEAKILLSLIRSEIEKDYELHKLLKMYKSAVSGATKRLWFTPPDAGLEFEQENGHVMFNKNILCKLKIGTRMFRFFEILFENIDTSVSHERIGERLGIVKLDSKSGEYIPAKQLSKSLSDYLADIKSRLPIGIRNLISTPLWAYMLDTTKIVREK